MAFQRNSILPKRLPEFTGDEFVLVSTWNELAIKGGNHLIDAGNITVSISGPKYNNFTGGVHFFPRDTTNITSLPTVTDRYIPIHSGIDKIDIGVRFRLNGVEEAITNYYEVLEISLVNGTYSKIVGVITATEADVNWAGFGYTNYVQYANGVENIHWFTVDNDTNINPNDGSSRAIFLKTRIRYMAVAKPISPGPTVWFEPGFFVNPNFSDYVGFRDMTIIEYKDCT